MALPGYALPLLGAPDGRRADLIPPPRRVRIAVDAAGADTGPAAAVDGALAALDEVDLLLVGPEDMVRERLGDRPPAEVSVLHAPETIGMAEDPVLATRTKRRSSMLLAARAVAGGAADAMVSPGNAGAVVLAAATQLRRLPGVQHPALATLLPVPGGGAVVLLDAGAAPAASPDWLAQYAVLGAGYARARLGLAEPRIGLLANGHEDGKGAPVHQQAHELLAGLPGATGRYLGRIEAYDLLGGRVDVAVTDGFTGDVVLKMHERTLEASAAVVAAAAPGAPHAVDALWTALAPEAGAVLLGVRGVCVKCHGAAPAHDIEESVRLAAACVRAEVTRRVAEGFSPPGPGSGR